MQDFSVINIRICIEDTDKNFHKELKALIKDTSQLRSHLVYVISIKIASPSVSAHSN